MDDEYRRAVEALGDILAHYADREQAPGHSHLIPCVWDRDIGNGAKGGTACEWCTQWENAKSVHATAIRALSDSIPDTKGGRG